MTEQRIETDKMDQPLSLWLMLFIPFYVLGLLSLVVFPFAGNWSWLEGWIFVVSLALNLSISTIIMNQKNPRVLRNRSKMRKEGLTKATKQSASSDRFILPLMGISFFGAVIVADLGHRFGWYALPLWAALAGAVIMNIGVIILNTATLQNAYASKLLDINKGQVLVDTGLYGRVRHPLYTGGTIMMLFMPVALGSLWGLIPAAMAALTLVVRIRFEEEMLLKGMEGYADYQSRVPYKLIPGIY
ncbi:MAG: isoprenylcysteine carboxylmethyltransferase family protein [Chloroflexi bacterium]|nr:MAG: isoprenylcysteine carboxylmethyltransferase family protein [Chloroflexota bacterium]MBL1193043.1 isoprenylcysteine carboxylmethyltransferase family protein [Chloroflexota bacterium]NOH10336.1 isoprenylcysteine carboxylmethyltransferase family protein [Chloroflexota bacterium]